jgi:hypothetical protein
VVVEVAEAVAVEGVEDAVLVAAREDQDLNLQFRLPYLHTMERALLECQNMPI